MFAWNTIYFTHTGTKRKSFLTIGNIKFKNSNDIPAMLEILETFTFEEKNPGTIDKTYYLMNKELHRYQT